MRTVLLLFLSAAAAAASVSVDLVSVDASGCRLLFSAGTPAASAAVGAEAQVDLEGMGVLGEPGKPMIPAMRVYVPVPPGSEPVLEYSVLERAHSPAFSEAPQRAPALEGSGLGTVEVEAPPLPGPSVNVELACVLPLAGFSFAALDIYPWLGEPGEAAATRIAIDISWGGAPAGAASTPSSLARLVCPFEMPFYRLGRSRAESPFWGLPWARITIGGSGGYEVTCPDLVAAGCDVEGVQSASLALFSGPGEMFAFDPEDEHALSAVDIEVLDGGDGVFDGGDRIRFIGCALERWVPHAGGAVLQRHRWDAMNTYWLTWGGEPGCRIASLQSAPDASPQYGSKVDFDVLVEEDRLWETYENETGWVWMTLPPGTSATVPFSLGFDPAGPAELEFDFCDNSSVAKSYSIYLDGRLILEGSYARYGSWTETVSGVDLSSGGQFTIATHSSNEKTFFFDRVHIRVPRPLSDAAGEMLLPGCDTPGRFNMAVGPFDGSASLYRIDDFHSPVRLIGYSIPGSTALFSADLSAETQILAVPGGGWAAPHSIRPASPGRLVGTVSGADRLIIVPEAFEDELAGLLALYSSSGLDCAVATTREVFDEFGQGVDDPGAIRSAVRWAMDSWEEPPGGVLLVGDGHVDAHLNTTSVPVMIFPWGDLSSGANPLSDDIYVMVHAGAARPELPIARLPVQTGQELLTCTAKILGGTTGANMGAWAGRMLFLADDEWGNHDSDEPYHTDDVETVAENIVPRRIERTKFYLIEYPWPPSGTHPYKPDARADFIDLFSEGSAAVLFMGHGSANQITHEGVLFGSDVSLLSNGGRLPVTLWASCDVGHFDGIGEDAIGERMLLHPTGGAVASIAATRGTGGPSNFDFACTLFDLLFSHPGMTVAQALWQAKLSGFSSYSSNRYYCLFGDLETVLPSPSGSVSFTVPGDTLRTGETNRIEGVSEQQTGTAFVTVRESSSPVTYVCRHGTEIDYLRYGGTAFRGSAVVTGGLFGLDCILPMQSVAGPGGRVGGAVPAPSDVDAGGLDPVPVAVGDPAGGDFEGPVISMWIEGQEGVEQPVVSGDPVLIASISDPSGICFLGGSGRQLTLFVDSEGKDVGSFFSYEQGSATDGLLDYAVRGLPVGGHRLILWCFDGVGNSSRDTLMVTVRAPGSIAISESMVYPNPGSGQRCFSFRLTEDAAVSVSIHTVAGRCIRTLRAQCVQGYNQILWDGLDADGDEPATGAYIYRIEAAATGASSFRSEADVSGVLAVVR